MPLQIPPVQSLNQYMRPAPPADPGGSFVKGQQMRSNMQKNALGELALQEAPAQLAHERAGREREATGWRQEDILNIRKMVAGHLGSLDTSDPEKFIQGAEVILPQLARDLDQAYGEKATNEVAMLKTVMDDLENPEKLPQIMGLADTYRTMLAGPQKPLNALQQAQAMKALRDAGQPYPEPRRSVEDEMRIRAAGRTSVNTNVYTGKLTPMSATGAQKEMIGSSESLSRLTQIAEQFKPEYLQVGPRVEGWYSSVRERFGLPTTTDEKTFLREYQTFRSTAINNINRYIKEMTGAQMSEKEADRIRLPLPDPGEGLWPKQSGTQFKAALDNTMKASRLAMARYNYYLSKGLDENGIKAMIRDESGISLEQTATIIQARENVLQQQGLEREQIAAKLKEEFGL